MRFAYGELYSAKPSYIRLRQVAVEIIIFTTTLIARLKYHFATCGKISHKPIGLYITVYDSKQYNSTRDPHVVPSALLRMTTVVGLFVSVAVAEWGGRQ